MYASKTSGLAGTVGAVRRDIAEILNSGKYYVTEEVGRELNAISNGLDHLKLDADLLTTSPSWQKNTRGGVSHNAVEVLDKAAGALFDYKSKMGVTSIEKSQENEIRELHHWAVQNLKKVQQDMAPFTLAAADRIKQFGDHIGVTDRYTGYRHNLTRPRDPFQLEAKWMDKNTQRGALSAGFYRSQNYNNHGQVETRGSVPSAQGVRFGTFSPSRRDTKGYQTIDSLYPRSNTMYVDKPATYSEQLQQLKAANAMNANQPATTRQNVTQSLASGPRNLSVQEQAGINTTFPGTTEYMTRYKRPPMDIKTSHFIINPTPDFSLHGRPLGLTTYQPSFTEYQFRYEWPDGNKIVKLPWRRK